MRKKAKKTKGKRESVSEEEIDAIVRDETLSVLDRVKKLRKLNVPYIHIGKKFGEPNGWVQYLLKGSVRKKANKTKPSSQASEPAHRKRGRPRKSETLTVKQAAENSAERLKVSVHSITNNGGYAEIVLHVPIAQARSFYVGECELKVVTP